MLEFPVGVPGTHASRDGDSSTPPTGCVNACTIFLPADDSCTTTVAALELPSPKKQFQKQSSPGEILVPLTCAAVGMHAKSIR